jgi:hypothetical protein
VNERILIVLACIAACGGSPSTNATATTPASAVASSPSGSNPCGDDTVASAKKKGGLCLEPAVLGADATARCQAYLQQDGWQHDTVAEATIGQRTGQTIVCFRAPDSAAP